MFLEKEALLKIGFSLGSVNFVVLLGSAVVFKTKHSASMSKDKLKSPGFPGRGEGGMLSLCRSFFRLPVAW